MFEHNCKAFTLNHVFFMLDWSFVYTHTYIRIYIYAGWTSVSKPCRYTVYNTNRDQASDGFCFIVKCFWGSEGNRNLEIIFSLCKLCFSHFTLYYPYTFLSFYWNTSCRITKKIFTYSSFPLLITLSQKDNRMKKVKVGCGKNICM